MPILKRALSRATILVCSLVTSIAAGSEPDKASADAIASVFSAYDKDKRPGVSVGVSLDNENVLTAGFGVANLAFDVPATADTVFNIGSVSKQFTVWATLLLVHQHKLDTGDDIRQFLPEMHDFGVTITVEDLIRHTSGLKSANFLARMAGWRQEDLYTHPQMLNLIFRQTSLEFDPGSSYRYSNSGTVLLAEIVQRVSGMSFAAYMEKEIFIPLGMSHTFVRDDVSTILDHETDGYYFEEDKWKYAVNPAEMLGYSNVYSSVGDLLKWANFLNDPPEEYSYLVGLINSPTILSDGRSVDHAMGQFITPYRGKTQYQHTGSHRAYLAYLGRFPEMGLSIAILSNDAGFDLFGKSYAIVDAFMTGNESSSEAVQEQVTQVELPSNLLARFVGHYYSDEFRMLRQIELTDGKLFYSAIEGEPRRLVAESETRFRLEDSNVTLEFSNQGILLTDGFEKGTLRRVAVGNEDQRDLADYVGVYYSPELGEAVEFAVRDQQLIATTSKLDPVVLTPSIVDVFDGDQWFMNHFRFLRNDNQSITGVSVSNVGVSEVRFRKINFGVLSTPSPASR